MPSFLEIQFPTDISWGVTGGAEFLTDVAVVDSGQEVRNVGWTFPRGVWDVTAGIRTATDYARLLAFFYAVQGKAYGFRFKDWTDYTDGGIGLVLSDGANNRLYKRYTFSGSTYDRMITKPTGTIVLAGGGSCAAATGIVTGGTAGTAWTGQFDVPARFDTDKMQMQAAGPDAGAWQNFTVVAIRP
jgi:uncharacterized protein (TIGR02217 family)